MWIGLVLGGIVALNAGLAMVTVLRQPRDISATWGWLLVLLLIPVAGFGLYWLFGRKIASSKLNALLNQQRLGIDRAVAAQQEAVALGAGLIGRATAEAGVPELVRTLLQADGALVTTLNQATLITTRPAFNDRLFTAVRAARQHVHIEAYTIEPDATGQALRDLLTQRAAAGVLVRILYDPFGSHRLTQAFWQPLRDAGGQVTPFIAGRLARANPRINFRNHRKLAVIDGSLGFLGGFDIGSSPKRVAITRDTALALRGSAVAVLQARFLMDWNTAAKAQRVAMADTYFPKPRANGQVTLQIVSGGPEQPLEAIKLGYLRLIAMAKHSVWLQSPYFVPDESLLDALTIAINAGIDVRIMVPRVTAQPLMAKATRFYLDRLVRVGAQVYFYQAGFLHNKVMVVDGRYLVTGTANLDIRSFSLNFEIAAFVYSTDLAKAAAAQFTKDCAASLRYTHAMAKVKPRRTRLAEELSRLLAPIL
ncbi:cardiolipin synthase [Lacticaseibacillus parakribbianus]|uniref:cardiolipin synthase n=1 Tax=Lacticaseibacillus parakribbianus TaxID=2970927 RepID=UPI0021CB42AE|nr:cardiolipin synthase [Lacticaseibacillus parakribbianus]